MDVERRSELIKRAGFSIGERPGGEGTPYLCSCGCGESVKFTKNAWSLFRPGHDARLVGNTLKLVRAHELNINEAVELVDFLFSPALGNKLLRLWMRVAMEHRTCPVGTKCGQPSQPGHPQGWCAEHAAS